MNDQNTYILAMAAGALVRALGMFSENMQCTHTGDPMDYRKEDFKKLADEAGLYHNAILTIQRGE